MVGVLEREEHRHHAEHDVERAPCLQRKPDRVDDALRAPSCARSSFVPPSPPGVISHRAALPKQSREYDRGAWRSRLRLRWRAPG